MPGTENITKNATSAELYNQVMARLNWRELLAESDVSRDGDNIVLFANRPHPAASRIAGLLQGQMIMGMPVTVRA